MNKIDLIQALRDAADLTKQEAEKAVTVFFNDMGSDLDNSGRVGSRILFPDGMENTNFALNSKAMNGHKKKFDR